MHSSCFVVGTAVLYCNTVNIAKQLDQQCLTMTDIAVLLSLYWCYYGAAISAILLVVMSFLHCWYSCITVNTVLILSFGYALL